MQRNEQMTFTAICKEAWALEQEMQDGEETLLSHRVSAPVPWSTTTVDMEHFRAELQQELSCHTRV